MCDQQRLRPACAYAQSGRGLCFLHKCSMTVTLLTKSSDISKLNGGCKGMSEYTHVKTPHKWNSHCHSSFRLMMIRSVLYFFQKLPGKNTTGCTDVYYCNFSLVLQKYCLLPIPPLLTI